MNTHLYTDGTQVVEAVLFADNHRTAHQAFNIINETPLDALVAPIVAIDYILNNGSITLRNKERVVAGEYIVKHEDGSIRKYTSQEFHDTYREVTQTKSPARDSDDPFHDTFNKLCTFERGEMEHITALGRDRPATPSLSSALEKVRDEVAAIMNAPLSIPITDTNRSWAEQEYERLLLLKTGHAYKVTLDNRNNWTTRVEFSNRT